MDKKLKIFWCFVTTIFLITLVVGALKGGIEEKKGMIQVNDLLVVNNNLGLLNSYSVKCKVRPYVDLNYLKMRTIYYDKYGNTLSSNNNSWSESNKIIANGDIDAYEMIGYNAGAKGALPARVEIFFTDKPDDNKTYIYKTSLNLMEE
ncbi:MAG: hypothetical protein LBR15_03115 [Methanobrevibacter sp.]|nr:hypothetical protein [Candidatus Methanovirga australis]